MTEIIKKKISIMPFSIGAAVIAGVLTVITIVTAKSDNTSAIRNLNLGNQFLLEMDYDQAIAAYTEALEIEPQNREALLGVMQAAYQTGDLDLLEKTYMTYLDVVGTESSSDTDQMMEQIRQLRKEANLEKAVDLVQQGKYEEANELVEKIAEDSPEGLDMLRVELMQKCAEKEWEQRDFEEALDYLEQAYELAEDKEKVGDELSHVAENYIVDCINHQEYETARKILSWLQDLRGDNSLQEFETKIADMEAVDSELQIMIDNLNAAFDANDIEKTMELMQDEGFKNNGRKIRTVIYSNSLKESKEVNGNGTAIYNVGGKLYIYYGEFSDGLRNGEGQYYYYDEDYEELCHLISNWENDFPNSESILNDYIVVHNVDDDTTEMGHNISQLSLDKGVYEGIEKNHGESIYRGMSYSYDFEVEYSDGYAIPKIASSECPYEIARHYQSPPTLDFMVIVGGLYLWRNHSNTERFVIPGLSVRDGKTQVSNEKILIISDNSEE